MKQIEVVVQKALGSNLVEDSSLMKDYEFQNDEEIRSGYLNNIPHFANLWNGHSRNDYKQ